MHRHGQDGENEERGAEAAEPDGAPLLDALGLRCPLPVLKLRKRLQPLAAGDRLRILADDPAALIDIPHFCAEQGHVLISQQEVEGPSGEAYLFEVEKA